MTKKQQFAHAYNWLRGQLKYRNWDSAIRLYPRMRFTSDQILALNELNTAHTRFQLLIEKGYEEVKELTLGGG